jgi:hypothetical protein
LLFEEEEGFLAGAADAFVHVAGPLLHLLVHPVTAGVAIDDADAFADRIQDKLGLLGDERAFEGEEVAGVGEDGIELFVAEDFDGPVDAGRFDHIAIGSQGVEKGSIGG